MTSRWHRKDVVMTSCGLNFQKHIPKEAKHCFIWKDIGKNVTLSSDPRLLVPSSVTWNRKWKSEVTGHWTRLYFIPVQVALSEHLLSKPKCTRWDKASVYCDILFQIVWPKTLRTWCCYVSVVWMCSLFSKIIPIKNYLSSLQSMLLPCSIVYIFWAQVFKTIDVVSYISLKLCSLNIAYTLIFWLKNVSSFYSHFFFQQKRTCELDIVLTRTVNILTTNELVKLTMLWTTGTWSFVITETIPRFPKVYLGQWRDLIGRN